MSNGEINMWNRFRFFLTKKSSRVFKKKDINIEELKKMIMEGALLVDVRSPQEYQEGHLKGAKLIPEYEIMKTCRYELKDKSAVIILYCSTGSRSKKAQRKLEKIGYQNVYNLYNGIQNFNFDIL